jgi:hypothetical protein
MTQRDSELCVKYGISYFMQNQWDSFNGDDHVKNEFRYLRDKFLLTSVVEGGTCIGSTTLALSEIFDRVYTTEINIEFLNVAHKRFKEAGLKNVVSKLCDTGEFLYQLISEWGLSDDTLFFLDDHWGSYCPLKDELKAIALAGIKPVIAIHDFKVPEQPNLGYDIYNGQPLELSWIFSDLNEIYGQGEWEHYYNTEKNSAGAKRGIIYVYGKVTD